MIPFTSRLPAVTVKPLTTPATDIVVPALIITAPVSDPAVIVDKPIPLLLLIIKELNVVFPAMVCTPVPLKETFVPAVNVPEFDQLPPTKIVLLFAVGAVNILPVPMEKLPATLMSLV